MAAIYLSVALLCSRVLAIPIPDPLVSVETGPSTLALVLGLSIPFAVLAGAKYAYMKYRRAESIHSEAEKTEVEAEIHPTPTLVGLGIEHKVLRQSSRKLKLKVLSGYPVGMLGSPEWETRVKVRMDRAMRKSRRQPSDIEVTLSRAVSPSTASRSRFHSSHRSRDTSVGYRSSRHPSSHASSKSRAMSLSFLEMYSPDSNINDGGQPSSFPCSDGLPQLPPLTDSARSRNSSSQHRKQISQSPLSPTLMQMLEPVVTSWQEDTPKPDRSHDTGGSGRSGSHSPTPSFQTPPSTPAKSFESFDNSRSTEDGSSKSTSTILKGVPQQASSQDLIASAVGKGLATEKARQTSPKLYTAPLFSTPRPLNIKSDMEHLPINPAKYLVERSIAPRPKPQGRKSGSPSIGPSPLRNPVTSSSSSSLFDSKANLTPSIKTSDSRAIAFMPDAPSWELDDLMKNGRLDIDAVTEALGLGFALNDNSISGSGSGSRSPTCATSFTESLLRKPGGPLCPIPEESDMDDSAMDDNLRPLSSLIERWGRIHQKFNVETAGEVRESVSSSILEVDLNLLGIDVSAISGIGTPIMLPDSGSPYRDTTYTIEALETDDDSSSGWLEDSNVSSEGVGVAC